MMTRRWLRRGLGFASLLTMMVCAAVAVGRAAPSDVPATEAPTAEAWSDTLHVAAPRVTLDEIMADIGRRQRANRDSLRSVAFTAVVTTARSPDGVAVGAADSAGTWELEEIGAALPPGPGPARPRGAAVGAEAEDRARRGPAREGDAARASRAGSRARPTW